MVGRFPLGRTSHSGVIVKIDKNYFALPGKTRASFRGGKLAARIGISRLTLADVLSNSRQPMAKTNGERQQLFVLGKAALSFFPPVGRIRTICSV